VTLRTAVDFGELLTVFGSLAPAALLARLVTGRAFAFRLRKVVDVDVLGADARDDLLPVDGLHVAQVVVVEQAGATVEDVCENKTSA
jgi:hypothetical protein